MLFSSSAVPRGKGALCLVGTVIRKCSALRSRIPTGLLIVRAGREDQAAREAMASPVLSGSLPFTASELFSGALLPASFPS